ncbi:MAG: hypothetical protein ACRCZF_20985 [Gemmataceae bacterium]
MRLSILLLIGLFALGCDSTPRAPVITNEPVYNLDSARLSFVVPEKWTMVGRAELPPGALPKPIVTVRYLNPNPSKSGELELVVAEYNEKQNIAAYLQENPLGGDKWEVGNPQSVTINDSPGLRYELTLPKKAKLKREVTVFRRGSRIYLFVLTFNASDSAVRDTVRVCLNSIRFGD